jgi:hypothetical protein
MRTITAAAVAVLALTLTACGSNGDNGDGKPEPAPRSPTATVSATPTVDQAAARQACVDAWLELLEAGDASADKQPAVCEQVPGQSAAMYAEALRKRNEANREQLDECLEDPACTELPIP